MNLKVLKKKVEEFTIREEKNENPKEMLLEHEKIVDYKIDVHDTFAVIASEDIPELMESSCDEHYVM